MPFFENNVEKEKMLVTSIFSLFFTDFEMAML